MTVIFSCLAISLGKEPAISARPPVFEKGNTSLAANNIFRLRFINTPP